MSIASWHLGSSSGREAVRWEVREVQAGRDGSALVCDVHLDGQYFGDLLGGADTRVRDYSLVLERLTVGCSELDRLSSFLQSWLRLPLAEQASHPPAFECGVGGLFDQILLMTLGRRDDTISGGKPVATFRFVVGRLTGELSFVTDPSCLAIMAEEIETVLKRAGPSSV